MTRNKVRNTAGTMGQYRIGLRLLLSGIVLIVYSSAAVAASAAASPTNTAKTDLQTLTEQKRYLDLEAALNRGEGDSTSGAIYRGILADSENDLDLCIRTLAPIAETRLILKVPGRDAFFCLRALADAYFKQFRYEDDAKTLTRLLDDITLPLTAKERQDAQDDLRFATSLAGGARQSADLHGACEVAASRNALGLTVVPATANGVAGSWIVDTGANTSVLCRSEAERMGIHSSSAAVRVQGANGSYVTAHSAIIPELWIGTACIHNTPAVVLEDKDLNIPAVGLQIKEVIGYPVLESLGNLTFLRDGQLVFDSSGSHQSDPGARMFLDGYTPVIAVTDDKDYRLCTFDSGAPNTCLYNTYERAHANEFANQPTVNIGFGGVGGSRYIPSYVPDHTTLTFGATTVTLGRLAVLTESHTADPELFYGNLGQDVIQASTSCTLDFRAMRFFVTIDRQKSQ